LRRALLTAVFVATVAALVGAFAATASAYPSKTTSCAVCHSGPNVAVTATQTSNNGTTASYGVSAPGAYYVAVFDGATKIGQVTGSAGTISVADGKTYVLQAVQGPTTGDGWGTTSISPVAPPADTTAPTTTSDAKATYVSSATVKLTAIDNAGGTGVAHTYYVIDGGVQAEGTTVLVGTVGTHSVEFWSVDVSGNVETPHTTVTFDVTAPVPVADTTTPITTSNAKFTYVTSAAITLVATDNAGGSGVAHTYYVIDGGVQAEGTTVLVGTVGTHTVEFWSADAAGNIETPHATATFTVTAAVSKTCTISASAYSVTRNHKARLSGVITPARVGTRVALYVKKPGSTRWVLVARPAGSTVRGMGTRWSYSYLLSRHGSYRFQARWSGKTSRTITVRSK